MGIEDNKAIIRRLFAAQVDGDLAVIESLLADDLAWQYMGNRSQDVTKDKAEMLAMQERLLDGWVESWTKTIIGMIAEGDGVAVEATNQMKMKDGRTYEQRYHYLYVIKDGKIAIVREYLDTDLAKRFFENQFP